MEEVSEKIQTPADTPKSKSHIHYKWLVIGVVASIVATVAVCWFLWARQSSQASQTELNQSSQETIESIATYEDCIEAGLQATEEEDTCTTPDGRTFFAGEENLYDQDELSEEGQQPTASAGDQTVELVIGSDPEAMSTLLSIDPGQSTLPLDVQVITQGIDVAACSLTIKSTPDKPGVDTVNYTLAARSSQQIKFIDGNHEVSVKCPATEKTLEASWEFRAVDGQPELCAGYGFNAPTNSSASSAGDMQQKMVGTWKGCVDTPWWSTYYVTITFNANGSYSASSEEVLDGNISKSGFYSYSIEGAHEDKVFGVTSYQSKLGQGFLDIVHPNGTSVFRGDLRNIRLDGSTLMFDFYHNKQYGPLRFMLKK